MEYYGVLCAQVSVVEQSVVKSSFQATGAVPKQVSTLLRIEGLRLTGMSLSLCLPDSRICVHTIPEYVMCEMLCAK